MADRQQTSINTIPDRPAPKPTAEKKQAPADIAEPTSATKKKPPAAVNTAPKPNPAKKPLAPSLITTATTAPVHPTKPQPKSSQPKKTAPQPTHPPARPRPMTFKEILLSMTKRAEQQKPKVKVEVCPDPGPTLSPELRPVFELDLDSGLLVVDPPDGGEGVRWKLEEDARELFPEFGEIVERGRGGGLGGGMVVEERGDQMGGERGDEIMGGDEEEMRQLAMADQMAMMAERDLARGVVFGEDWSLKTVSEAGEKQRNIAGGEGVSRYHSDLMQDHIGRMVRLAEQDGGR